ncbi:MAG TPA: cupin domain-containing protein [Alphaproteobacteria bacterium]|nr:cupin domain-containing protein [Alphaproteobacteria bacterium]
MSQTLRNIDDIVHFENAPLAEPSVPIDPNSILRGNKVTERTKVQYTDKRAELTVGVWESDSGAWAILTQEDEFVWVMEGEIRITDDRGRSRTYGPGDSFFVPERFKGTWESLSPVRKIFVSLKRKHD